MALLDHQIQGGGGGPPLVLINGLGDLRSVWHHQRRTFARRHRTLSYDHPREGGGSIRDHARALLELIDASFGSAAVLVGHSFGGRVALAAALLDPARVLGLILAGTSCARHDTPPELRARKARSAEAWVNEVFPLLYGPRFIQEQGDRLHLLARGRAGAEEIAPPELWAAWDGWDEASRVPGISAPCLVIHGEADRVIAPEHGRRLAALVPSAELAVLPGVGHCPHVEDPEAFNRLVAGFLARITR